jgi:hypothetical protein
VKVFLILNKNYIMNKFKNKNNNKVTNLLKYIKNIAGLILLFVGRYFYIKSLKGCYGDEYACVNFGLNYILEDIYFCVKSSFFFIAFLFLI